MNGFWKGDGGFAKPRKISHSHIRGSTILKPCTPLVYIHSFRNFYAFWFEHEKNQRVCYTLRWNHVFCGTSAMLRVLFDYAGRGIFCNIVHLCSTATRTCRLIIQISYRCETDWNLRQGALSALQIIRVGFSSVEGSACDAMGGWMEFWTWLKLLGRRMDQNPWICCICRHIHAYCWRY